jgi:hypothetical protein
MKTHRETECALLYIFRRIGLADGLPDNYERSVFAEASIKGGK